MKVKKPFRDVIRPYLYLSPALISIAFFTLLPVVQTILISFQDRTYANIFGEKNFVGLENYKAILQGDFKPTFFPVLIWTFIFAACICCLAYMVGLLLAILLNNPHMKEKPLYKSILILPWALPPAIAALSWQGLLNAQYGGINKLLKGLGLINENVEWIVSTITLARVSVIMVAVWFTVPFMMNACLGALTSIPDTYYEAAEIDGASKWTQFIKITLPSIASSSFPLVISSFAFNFNNFGGIFMITEGNPPDPNSAFAGGTDILISAAYKLNNVGNYSWAAALAVIVFLIIGTISFIQMRMSGQFKEVD